MVYEGTDNSIKGQYFWEGSRSVPHFKEECIVPFNMGLTALQGRINVFVVKDEGHNMLRADMMK